MKRFSLGCERSSTIRVVIGCPLDRMKQRRTARRIRAPGRLRAAIIAILALERECVGPVSPSTPTLFPALYIPVLCYLCLWIAWFRQPLIVVLGGAFTWNS